MCACVRLSASVCVCLCVYEANLIISRRRRGFLCVCEHFLSSILCIGNTYFDKNYVH